MERLLDDVSFHAARRTGDTITIDAEFVDATLAGIAGDDNLSALHPVTRSEVFERILGIILPVFVIVLVGYFYARRVKPDMAAVNQISMTILAPALIFLGAGEQGLQHRRKRAR